MAKGFQRINAIVFAISLLAIPATACAGGKYVTAHLTVSGAGSVAQLYAGYLKANPSLTIVGDTVGEVTIVQFLESGRCPEEGCYTAVVAKDASGNFHQVFSQKAQSVQYAPGNSSFPEIRVNDFSWVYTPAYGYIADLNATGKAFVPGEKPRGDTAKQIYEALKASGWPGGNTPIPALIQEVNPGGNAPTTVVVAPDETTTAGQEDCAVDDCHIWLLVYQHGKWIASSGTTGTGLVSVLPPDGDGNGRIGVGVRQGINVFTWLAGKSKWQMTGSTVQIDKRYFQQ